IRHGSPWLPRLLVRSRGFKARRQRRRLHLSRRVEVSYATVRSEFFEFFFETGDMKMRRIAAAVLFAFLPATVSFFVFALAQEDATTVQARARFKEGVEAYDKGRYEEVRFQFY